MLLNRLHLKSNRHSIQRYYNVSWFFDISHCWDTIKMNGRSQSTLFYGKLKRNWFHMMDSSLRNLILMMFGGVTVNVANARWKVVVDSDFEVMRSNLGNRLHFTMPVFSKFINRYTQTKKAKNKKNKETHLVSFNWVIFFCFEYHWILSSIHSMSSYFYGHWQFARLQGREWNNRETFLRQLCIWDDYLMLLMKRIELPGCYSVWFILPPKIRIWSNLIALCLLM